MKNNTSHLLFRVAALAACFAMTASPVEADGPAPYTYSYDYGAYDSGSNDYGYSYDYAPYSSGSNDYGYSYDYAPYSDYIPSYVDTSPSWQPAYVDTAPSWTQPVYYSQPYNTYNNNYRTDYSYYPGTYYASTPYVASSYDYSYDYVYDYYSEYTYDACSNIRGDQPRGYDCYPDRDRDEDVSCDLSVSDSRVEEGDRVTLEWETDGNPNYASINQGIGRVDEDGGDERVEIDGDTTFRMTVRNNDGDEDTC